MIRAYKLFTGPDNASHVLAGTLEQENRVEVASIEFAETPAHSSLDWHDAPVTQYVITLSGTLALTTRDGESFTLRPGEVLVAADTAGGGHAWRIEGDEPWRRAYIVLEPGAADRFAPNT